MSTRTNPFASLPSDRKAGPTDQDIVLAELRRARGRGRTIGDFRAMAHFNGRHQSISRLLHDMREEGTLITLQDVRPGDMGRDQHIHVLPLFAGDRPAWPGRKKAKEQARPFGVCTSCGAIQD